jgi:hypothetical protein
MNRGRRPVPKGTRYRRIPKTQMEAVPLPRSCVGYWDDETRCTILVDQEPTGPAGEPRWHLSISHPDQYPEWDWIADARYALVPDETVMVMFLPPRSEYVNVHENCFHLHECPEAKR